MHRLSINIGPRMPRMGMALMVCGLWACGAGFAQDAAAPPQSVGTDVQPAGGASPAAATPDAATPDTATPAATAPVYEGPKVRIDTTAGAITLTLDVEHAPATAQNFLRYVRQGRFNGTVVYRVEPGFVMQMGCVDLKGHGCKQNPPVPLESGNGLKNIRGSVAMAHGEKPNTATSEFFINLADNAPLDPLPADKPNTTGFAVFAHVTDGMAVADAIAAGPRKGGYGPFPDAAPQKRIIVRKVTLIPAKPAATKKK